MGAAGRGQGDGSAYLLPAMTDRCIVAVVVPCGQRHHTIGAEGVVPSSLKGKAVGAPRGQVRVDREYRKCEDAPDDFKVQGP